VAGARESQDTIRQTQDTSSATVDQVMVNQVKSLKTINVKGFVVTLKNTPTLLSVLGSPIMTSFYVWALSEEKYLERTDKATRTEFFKFDLLVIALKSICKLDKTYALNIPSE